MKILVKKFDKIEFNKVLDWLLYLLCYTFVIFINDILFDSLYSKNIIYDLLAVILINILNKTIKPIIVKLTIPITALTLGLFYPFINLFILKIVDYILGINFDIYGVFWGLFIAIMISMMNLIIEYGIIKPIIRRGEEKWKE